MTRVRTPIERPPMFRRRRFVSSHQRPGLIRLVVRPLALAVGIVGLPAVAAYWLFTSPRFELRDIHIATGERVPATWIADNLEVLRGRHILLLSLPEVEGLLADHRWVDGVEVSKRLPDSLVVEVLEREPRAVVETDGIARYVDGDGQMIDRVEPQAVPSLLLIEAEAAEPSAVALAVATVEQLGSVGRRLFDRIEKVEILAGTDLELTLAEHDYTILVRPGRLEPAVRRFEQLQSEIERRYSGFVAVDLRFHRQIVMQFPEA